MKLFQGRGGGRETAGGRERLPAEPAAALGLRPQHGGDDAVPHLQAGQGLSAVATRKRASGCRLSV